MGKRVSFAELAAEEVPDFAPTPQPGSEPANPRADKSRITAVPEPTAKHPLEPAEAAVDLGETLLPLADIAGNPLNRPGADDETDDEDFRELVDTVRQHGVLQSIVVCSSTVFTEHFPAQRDEIAGATWVVLMGNRRLKAAVEVGLTEIPAVVNDERVTLMYEVMLVENGHRKNLSPLDEAEAMSRVLEQEQVTRATLARRIGRTPMYVTQRLALLNLVPELRDALAVGILKLETARQFGALSEEEQRAIVEQGQPYRRVTPQRQTGTSARRISAATPQQAAESIRKLFNPDELTELIRLLGTRE